MARRRDGDFEIFVRAATPRLRRLASAWCAQDPHRADDLVQATLERVYSSWSRVLRREDAFAYARTTMMRLMISEERLSWRARERPTAQPPERPTTELAPEGTWDVLAAIGDLPPRQRAVVLLRFVEDQSVTATAATLKSSTGTVKSQTADATAALRRRLEPVTSAEDEEARR